jgi:polyhydroxyalkanoate synthesis regulator phasin
MGSRARLEGVEMVEDLFRSLRSKGEEMVTDVSNRILANPAFVEVLKKGMVVGEAVEKQVGSALKKMNVATRKDLSKMEGRIAELESELAALKSAGAKRTRSK